MVEDSLQDLDSSTCGIFHRYFYDNLFSPQPQENSEIQNNTRLTKKIVETLLNESFVKDRPSQQYSLMEHY